MYETEKENSIHFYLQNHLIFGSVKQKSRKTFIGAFTAYEILFLVMLVQVLQKVFLL